MKIEKVRKQLLKDPKFAKAYYSFDLPLEMGEALIELRVKLGLTQQQLADKCGMKQEAIARLESTNYKPSIRTINRIAQAVKKTVRIQFV